MSCEEGENEYPHEGSPHEQDQDYYTPQEREMLQNLEWVFEYDFQNVDLYYKLHALMMDTLVFGAYGTISRPVLCHMKQIMYDWYTWVMDIVDADYKEYGSYCRDRWLVETLYGITSYLLCAYVYERERQEHEGEEGYVFDREYFQQTLREDFVDNPHGDHEDPFVYHIDEYFTQEVNRYRIQGVDMEFIQTVDPTSKDFHVTFFRMCKELIEFRMYSDASTDDVYTRNIYKRIFLSVVTLRPRIGMDIGYFIRPNVPMETWEAMDYTVPWQSFEFPSA